MLGLLDGHLNFLWHVQMDKGVHSTSILFEHLSLLDDPGEVSENESISGVVRNPEHLNCQLILKLLIDIALIKHLLGFQEEWVSHILGPGILLHVLKHLLHRNNWHPEVNAQSLGDLVLERVWPSEENNLWLLRPSLQVVRALLLKNCFQHLY